MSGRLYWFYERLLDFRSAIENPRLDPDKTLAAMALVIALVVLVFVVGLAVFSRTARRLKRRPWAKMAEQVVTNEVGPVATVPETSAVGAAKKDRPRADVNRKSIIGGKLSLPAGLGFGTLAVGLILLSTLFYGTTYVARPGFCAKCHTMQASYAAWKESSHRGVACNACHARPGVTGYFSRQLDFAGESFAEAAGKKPSLKGAVANSSCLRCHRQVLSKTLKTETLKVRHSDFLAEGAVCGDCHSAHSQAPKQSMSRCIVCHNGTDAPSACRTCHIKDVGALAKSKRRLVKINSPPIKRCSGCHQTDKCTSHHGTEMPHQSTWLREHGKAAESPQESVCWRCHDRENYSFCRRCHTAIPPHKLREKPGWIENHGPVVLGQRPSAMRACAACHQADFCGSCHDADGPRLLGLAQRSPLRGEGKSEGP